MELIEWKGKFLNKDMKLNESFERLYNFGSNKLQKKINNWLALAPIQSTFINMVKNTSLALLNMQQGVKKNCNFV